jgi:hypothetical protein
MKLKLKIQQAFLLPYTFATLVPKLRATNFLGVNNTPKVFFPLRNAQISAPKCPKLTSLHFVVPKSCHVQV